MTNSLSLKDFCNFLNTSVQWNLFFKVTNLCNFSCAHCCECSGPDQAATFIPMADVRAITDNFNREKNRNPIAAISGGEPMTAYNYANYYISQLMKTLASRGLNIEFKTNAAWAIQDGAVEIFADLEKFSIKYPNIYVAYHLSLDSFHLNAKKYVSEFIRWYYDNDKLSKKTCLHIFYDNKDRLADMLIGLAQQNGIMLDMKNETNGEFAKIGAKQFVNKNKYIVMEPYSGISNLGRARQNRIATHGILSVQKQFLDKHNKSHSITFDNRGMAFIDCVSDMAVTPYKDARGHIKPISLIKRELFEILYKQYLIEKGR